MQCRAVKNWLKFLPIVALLGLAAFWWLHPRSSVSSGSRYRTATVGRGDVTQTVTASGSLDAVTTVQVGSQVSGNIVKLYADYNDAVKDGQLIAEIEPSTYEASLVQAEAT